jgi:very-short-patch-repair endonuclease
MPNGADTFGHMVAARPFGPAGEFAASRHGALTRSQAATSGLTDTVIRRLLRDAVLREPTPGVLVVVGSPATWHQQLYVATLAAKASGVAGARSAAALYVVDDHPQGPLELLVTSHRRIDLPDVVVRRGPIHPLDVHEVDGIACTNVARMLCDLGSIEHRAQLKMAFEWAWRNGHSLTWIEQTALRLVRPRRMGPARVLELVREARLHQSPTASALEVNVEAAIDGLPGLVRQFVVRTAAGEFIGRVDFAIPHLKIAIEAHSRRHHFGPQATESDGTRESAMQAEGWVVRYVTDADRRSPTKLRASLLALIASRRGLVAAMSAASSPG